MFPPLCFVNPAVGFVEESEINQIKSDLSEEEFSLISVDETSSSTISFKFKIVEIMESVDQFFSNS